MSIVVCGNVQTAAVTALPAFFTEYYTAADGTVDAGSFGDYSVLV